MSNEKLWWYAKGDERFGPYTAVEFKGIAATGQLDSTDLIWKEGLPNWLPASSIKGLVPSAVPASPPPLPSKQQGTVLRKAATQIEENRVHESAVGKVPLHTVIDGLSISDGKKQLFKLIASTPLISAVGGMPLFKSDDKRLKPFGMIFNKNSIFNGWAFFFNGLYWLQKGMWKKGLLLALTQIITLSIIDEIFGYKVQILVALSFSWTYSAMANYDLYRKLVLKEDFWW